MNYTVKTLSEYQRLIERFEKFNDFFILPDLYLVVRIDGRRLGPEWKQHADADYPFAPQIAQGFLAAAREVFSSGVRVQYAFCAGDEISFLLDFSENANQRRRGKLLSFISSAASVAFFKETSLRISFYGVISELPSLSHVMDYFFWQRKSALRNFLAKHIFEIFSEKGLSNADIAEKISKLSEEERIKLYEKEGKPLSEFPSWQIRGSGVWWNSLGTSLEQCLDFSEKDSDYSAFLEEVFSYGAFSPKEVGEALAFRTMPYKKLLGGGSESKTKSSKKK